MTGRELRERVDGYPPAMSALVVLLVLLPVYLATVEWHGVLMNDVIATLHPAHQLATEGTWVVEHVVADTPWYVRVEGGFVSNRFPGTILHAVPAYVAAGQDEVTSEPGALTAALIAAAAMGVLHLVLRRVTTTWRAVVGALVAGLATSTWGISAAMMWTHAPGQLWLATALLAFSVDAFARSGLAFAVALLVRPQNAVIAAVCGLVRSWQRRAVTPAAVLGATTSIGLVLFVLYTRTVLGGGGPSDDVTPITGGYGSGPLDMLTSRPDRGYLTNLAGFFVSPSRGLVLQAPFLVVLALGVPAAWRACDGWVRAAALGGLGYLLVQARVNGFSGGEDFLVYRLPLEALTVAAPLLAVAYDRRIAGRRGAATVFWTAVAWSVAVQAIAAVVWSAGSGTAAPDAPWGAGEWQQAAREAGVPLLVALAAAVAAVAVAAWLRHPARDRPPADVRT